MKYDQLKKLVPNTAWNNAVIMSIEEVKQRFPDTKTPAVMKRSKAQRFVVVYMHVVGRIVTRKVKSGKNEKDGKRSVHYMNIGMKRRLMMINTKTISELLVNVFYHLKKKK